MILNFDPQFVKASKMLADTVQMPDRESVADEHYCGAKGLVVRLGTSLDEDFLSRFKKLKFVATVTTGTDHIDEEYCRDNGIKIISLKGETEFLEGIHATPEHAWGLLLSLIRNIPKAYESVLGGEWNRNEFFGHELYEKRLGIIGFGRVGKILARYARTFGMNVVACDINKIEEDKFNLRQVSLESILKTSDVVSVNLSLNESTRHFLGGEHFNLMKDTAILLNTSRGAVVDEAALLYALENGQIAGAALDVLENENTKGTISNKHPLVAYGNRNRNLLITPHIAGSTFESMDKTAIFIAMKIKDFLGN